MHHFMKSSNIRMPVKTFIEVLNVARHKMFDQEKLQFHIDVIDMQVNRKKMVTYLFEIQTIFIDQVY